MINRIIGKEVIYNGGTDSYYGCSDHKLLTKGKRYVVTGGKVRAWQTDYTLEGVEGAFNSVWFDEVKSKKTYFAITIEYHNLDWYIGKRMCLAKLHVDEAYFEAITTSPVQKVEHVYGDVYKIETENSLYITKVNQRTVG